LTAGVFSTSLSHEYQLAAALLDLSLLDLQRLACKAITYAFVPTDLKAQLVAKYFFDV